jgi:hypothetical protein
MEFPTVPELEAKVTGFILKVAGLALLVVGLVIWITTLTHQRNSARIQVAEQAQVIEGFKRASEAARIRMVAVAKAAALRREETVALVQDLARVTPQTNEEARAWALQAAGRIR